MAIEQLFFTDWPAGKGVEPSASGLQIKACSKGINEDQRWNLKRLCDQHGKAFSSTHIPNSVYEMEQDWKAKTDDLNDVPQHILDAFPVVWSYDRLEHDRFVLMRVGYTCLTNDGRTGNYFVHAIILSPEDLAFCNYNPLELADSNIFLSNDTSEKTVLESLEKLEKENPNQPHHFSRIMDAPYGNRSLEITTALCVKHLRERPVLICLKDWRHALLLTKDILYLLPPSIRCRTPFCTYETDRDWKLVNRQGATVSRRRICTIYAENPSSLRLRPDEYQSKYIVFNFLDNQFSEITSSPEFAEFIISSIKDKSLRKRLDSFHQMIEQMKLGTDADSWDGLISVLDLKKQISDDFDGKPSSELIKEAGRVMGRLIKGSAENKTPLEESVEFMRRLAGKNDRSGLESFKKHSDIEGIIHALTDGEIKKDAYRQIEEILSEALKNGHVGIVKELLGFYEEKPGQVLVKALPDALNNLNRIIQIAPKKQSEEITGLLIQCLSHSNELMDKPLLMQITEAMLFSACKAGILDEAWLKIGKTVIERLFKNNWTKEVEDFAKNMIQNIMPANTLSIAHAWISFQILIRYDQQTLKNSLEEISKISRICLDAGKIKETARESEDLVKELGELIEKQFGDDRIEYAVVTGKIADMTYRPAELDTQKDLFFLKRYLDAVEKADDMDAWKIRKGMAKQDALQILSCEFLNSILPWKEDKNERVFDQWYKLFLDSEKYGKVALDPLYHRIADKVKNCRDIADILPMVEKILEKKAKRPSGSGLKNLVESILLKLPIKPLPNEQDGIIKALHGTTKEPKNEMSSQAKTKLNLITFINHIEKERIQNPSWSISELTSLDSEWKWCHDVKLLDTEHDKIRIMKDLIKTFERSGIREDKDARTLMDILGRVNLSSAQHVVEIIEPLMANRDALTRCLVTITFARIYLEQTKHEQKLCEIIIGIQKQYLKPDERKLFADHLDRGLICRHDYYHDRLSQLDPSNPAVKTNFDISSRLTNASRSLIKRIFHKKGD